MKAVYNKELRSFFATIPGYLYIALLLLVTGVYCVTSNLVNSSNSFGDVLSYVCLFLVFLIPILTMRVFSEERRQRTEQLLLSLPISSGQIVLGKYLALVTVMLIPTAVMCLYPLVLTLYGNVDLLTAYSSIAGLFFLCCALCAIGMFISSLSENLIVSAIISFAVMFLLYRLSALELSPTASLSYTAFAIALVLFGAFLFAMTRNIVAALIPTAALELALLFIYKTNLRLLGNTFPTLVSKLDLFGRLMNFINGIFDITALVYYVTVVALFVFLTVRVLENARWNR